VVSARTVEPALRFLAFYLPQFHAIPENDKWWGEGFTEWTNVRSGKALFRGHTQPHVPAELGYYDLSDPSTRAEQARLAVAHGIDGFVYYHYWFHGKRLLEMPFNEVLNSGQPDFPFCLCWANENWTRVWDGGSDNRLISQTYCIDDDLRHIRSLLPAFADPRYIRVDGRPLFLVYRASDLPHSQETTDLWRAEAMRAGIGDLYLCRVEGHGPDRGDPRSLGFDAAIEFQPDINRLGPRRHVELVRRALRHYLRPDSPFRHHRFFSYDEIVRLSLQHPDPDYKRYRCLMPGWDNSARRRRDAVIIEGSAPSKYEHWVRETIGRFRPYSETENLVFVNAWNEWAEGSHLEPDQRWGRGYLEANARARGLRAPVTSTGDHPALAVSSAERRGGGA
jgi:lipopolysaccharide biosynthesis protein